ncbi:MAG: hypothetical protein ACREP8_03465 [Candidatus Binatia bacterium]
MQHRRAIAVKLLPVALLSVLLTGCSVAEYRQMYFSTFQPAPASRKIDAAVALETTASGFPDGNMGEAFRQVVTEDLASLFSKPLLEQRPDTEFLLRTTLTYQGMFPPSSVVANVILLDPNTGTKITSFSRKAEDSTFVGDVRMRQVADKLLRIVLPGLKEDLVRTFDGTLGATRRAPLQPFPGLQADR